MNLFLPVAPGYRSAWGAPSRPVDDVGWFTALIGLGASLLGSSKKKKEQKKQAEIAESERLRAEAEAKKAEDERKAIEVAAAAQAASAPPPGYAPGQSFARRAAPPGYAPYNDTAPAYAAYAPAGYRRPAPAYAQAPTYHYGAAGGELPGAGAMRGYGGGGRRPAPGSAMDQRSLQRQEQRAQVEASLSQFRSALELAERNYQTAYAARDAASVEAWGSYYQQVAAGINQLEAQRLQLLA